MLSSPALGEAIKVANTLYDRVLHWIEGRARAFWVVIFVFALVLRVLLVSHSPRPDGYTYDFYFEAVEFVNSHGRLPDIPECWQCYHPPLYYILGWVFYRLGWLLSGTREGALEGLTTLSMVGAAATTWYSIQLLRHFRQRGAYLLLGGAVLLVFPCLFITSWGAEADALQAALMSGFLYHLTRYDTGAGARDVRLPLLLGVLAGLAMATKHNGLLRSARGSTSTTHGATAGRSLPTSHSLRISSSASRLTGRRTSTCRCGFRTSSGYTNRGRRQEG